MNRRVILALASALVAVGVIVAGGRGRDEGENREAPVAPAPPPPKPIVAPSGAVAFEAPRLEPTAEAGAPSVARAIAASANEADAGLRVMPIDLATGAPLEPTRLLEGKHAPKPVPVPRRVLERGPTPP